VNQINITVWQPKHVHGLVESSRTILPPVVLLDELFVIVDVT
jgi:hypothetical protein